MHDHRPHWSYSQLSKYLRCPLSYFFEYELALPKRFVPSAAVLGTAVHEALATYHRSIQAGKPCDRETVLGTFLKTWIEREARETIRYGDDSRDDMLEQGGTLIGVYLQEPPPQNVVAVEQTLVSPIVTSDGEVLDRPLVSVLDLLTRDQSGLTITDFKTAGRSMSAAEADMSLQATAYSNAVKHNFDEPATFKFLVLVKTKTPKVQHVEAIRTESDLGRLGDLVRTVERAIDAEAFYPVESPLNCAGCPYRRPCREWTPQLAEELIPTINMREHAEPCGRN